MCRTAGAIWPVMAEFEAHGTQPCVSVIFRNLTAFTTYSLIAFSTGAEDGPSVVKEFTTLKSVPLQPPVLVKFGFSRFPQSNSLFVLWQPVPHETRGGANLTYDLEVLSSRGLELGAFGVGENYWLNTEPLPKEDLVVRVWSRNEIGLSESFSSLRISDVKPVPFQVEVSERKLLVHVDPVVYGVYKQIAVHMCETFLIQDDIEVCSSYPQTLRLSQAASASGAPQVHTFYLSSEGEPRVMTRQTFVHYMFSGSPADMYGDTNGTALAFVETLTRTEPRWVDVEPEGFLDSEEGDDVAPGLQDASGNGVGDEEDPDGAEDKEGDQPIQLKENMMKRSAIFPNSPFVYRLIRKRMSRAAVRLGKPYELHRSHTDTIQRGRRLLALNAGTGVDSGTTLPPNSLTSEPDSDGGTIEETSSFYRVFVSAQAEDGTWLGMAPANCYFSEESRDVRLVISQVIEEHNEDGPLVRWKQECDRQPLQFLVDSYEVSVSSDEACKLNVSLVAQVENSIFKPQTIRLQKGWPFVCIKASHRSPDRSRTFVKSLEVPMTMAAPKRSSEATIVTASAIPAALIILAFIGYYCFRCCKKGKDKINMDESQIQNMLNRRPGDDMKGGFERDDVFGQVQKPKWTSEQSGLATEGADSGQGTLYGQGLSGESNSNNSKLDRKTSAGSQSLSRYAIQGQVRPDRRRKNEKLTLKIDTSTIETATSGADSDHRLRVVEDSNATSCGDGWCDVDEDSSDSDSGQSSNRSGGDIGRQKGQIADVTSDGAGWLNDATGETDCSSGSDSRADVGAVADVTSDGAGWLNDATGGTDCSSGSDGSADVGTVEDSCGLSTDFSLLTSQEEEEEENLMDCSSPKFTKPHISDLIPTAVHNINKHNKKCPLYCQRKTTKPSRRTNLLSVCPSLITFHLHAHKRRGADGCVDRQEPASGVKDKEGGESGRDRKKFCSRHWCAATTATILANAAIILADSAIILADSATILAKFAIMITNSAIILANSCNILAKSAIVLARFAIMITNSAIILANSSNILAKSAIILANSAIILANSSNTLAKSAIILANSAIILAKPAIILANSAIVLAKFAIILANSAIILAN
ncbi:hypothetical protein ElyMa_005773500 [Elysia marginata]|uniref:Fibronectin type-III domain-containing protein n=1 Tax=Elysia marginata TaxID=1093978 RepID=A0AAV4FP56_9GAST|nr:hypothetical protein ElyMa_005773500 [Elysia marginata]